MQEAPLRRDRAGHGQVVGCGLEGRAREGHGGCSNGQGSYKGCEASILQPWGAGNQGLFGRGAGWGLQGLLLGSVGKGAQPSKSPYGLEVEEG